MALNLSQSENFSSVDAAWLHMDTPSNLANITGVMSFPTPLNFARLRATIEARLLPYIRFRQRISEPSFPLGLPRWELDPNFDLNYHLQATTLSGTKDHSALQDFVSELMSMPLDRSRPLWQFHYIDEVAGGSALVSRLHHCIADGRRLNPGAPFPGRRNSRGAMAGGPEPIPGKPGSQAFLQASHIWSPKPSKAPCTQPEPCSMKACRCWSNLPAWAAQPTAPLPAAWLLASCFFYRPIIGPCSSRNAVSRSEPPGRQKLAWKTCKKWPDDGWDDQ